MKTPHSDLIIRAGAGFVSLWGFQICKFYLVRPGSASLFGDPWTGSQISQRLD